MPYGYDDCEACHRRPPLCAECAESAYAYSWTTASVRGHRWADRLLQVARDASAPWQDTPDARAWAARSAADLCEDEAVRARLAAKLFDAAAERWAQLQADARARLLVLNSQPIRGRFDVTATREGVPQWKRAAARWEREAPEWWEEFQERVALKVEGASDAYLTVEQAEKAAFDEVSARRAHGRPT